MAKHVLNTHTNKKHFLYFVLAPSVSLAKIGITSDFETRFRTLQAGSPVDLEPWLVVRATARRELGLHVHFAGDRRHYEWFAVSDRMRALVEELHATAERDVSRLLARFDTGGSSWNSEKRARFVASHAARRAALANEQAQPAVIREWHRVAAQRSQRARAARLFAGIEAVWREQRSAA